MNIHHGCVGCVSLLHVCLHGLFVISCCAMVCCLMWAIEILARLSIKCLSSLAMDLVSMNQHFFVYVNAYAV